MRHACLQVALVHCGGVDSVSLPGCCGFYPRVLIRRKKKMLTLCHSDGWRKKPLFDSAPTLTIVPTTIGTGPNLSVVAGAAQL